MSLMQELTTHFAYRPNKKDMGKKPTSQAQETLFEMAKQLMQI